MPGGAWTETVRLLREEVARRNATLSHLPGPPALRVTADQRPETGCIQSLRVQPFQGSMGLNPTLILRLKDDSAIQIAWHGKEAGISTIVPSERLGAQVENLVAGLAGQADWA